MDLGRMLISGGLAIVLLGLAIKYAPWLFAWFGRLPGDIRIENQNSYFFLPVTSMVVISLILSLIVTLWLRK
ncbi:MULTISPECIES: DUF2905 domain-containing protein [Methylomonas]|uniref:DUF2905 domain-containing protein n=1 Tax=Methylomonas TaxID=416 RepID=UPI0012328F62|nr:DUF2905 domain-containing protein [Methylomonas rhizoryzae]